MEELIKLDAYPIKGLVRRLLQDKTTRKNILFASDSYAKYGAEYRNNSQMTENTLLGFDSCVIQPRVYKAVSEQTKRTRKHAEVFTPAWIVNHMNNHCDAEWFGRKNVFNRQNGKSWETNTEPISFPEGKDWKQYVDSRRLEITCGEAPYIVSRYDTSTGEIIPIEKRIGILDRKLRVVNENAADEAEWFKWVLRAFQSVYGYEYQGDNLLIARINLLYTLADYIEVKWHRQATQKELKKFLNIICWNIWQMNGINDTPPYGIPSDDNVRLSLFEGKKTTDADDETIYCKIYDWRTDISKLFKNMKFDFVIGNPPYQKERQGKSTTALPVYHLFMDSAYSVANAVELIHPARFLFNAGKTPKQWNKRILNDPHFKILMYEGDASTIFPNTEIKGGVVVSYRDEKADYGAIRTFTIYPQLNTILKKIIPYVSENSFASLAFVATKFNTTNLFCDYPQYTGHERRMSSNVLGFNCFHSKKRNADDIQIYGIYAKRRNIRYISKEYVDLSDNNIMMYKIVLPKADGNGAFGSTITLPEILPPSAGFTHTFLGIGGFNTQFEAEAALKYLKTKFARALLSALKVTQDINAEKWRYVPMQDFTTNSDIDWSKSIPEIDQRLYTKYRLTQEEIDFIETHVKEDYYETYTPNLFTL